jgi:hypothetical protein
MLTVWGGVRMRAEQLSAIPTSAVKWVHFVSNNFRLYAYRFLQQTDSQRAKREGRNFRHAVALGRKETVYVSLKISSFLCVTLLS